MQNQRLIIRAGERSLSFLKPQADGTMERLPYISKSGMSIAANLRIAFREEESLAGEDRRVLLTVCSPVSLVPLDEYMDKENFDAYQLYDYTFVGKEHEEKICNVIPELNAVAIFGVNKDLKLVVDDRFADVRIQNIMQPVWSHLYRRSTLVTQRRKLYGYFHDGLLDIFCFQQSRFRYANAFKTLHAHDALYYLLFVWKQLGLDAEMDELHLVGVMPHQDWLMEKLRQFLRRAYIINPVADLNRSPLSQIPNLEYDMML